MKSCCLKKIAIVLACSLIVLIVGCAENICEQSLVRVQPQPQYQGRQYCDVCPVMAQVEPEIVPFTQPSLATSPSVFTQVESLTTQRTTYSAQPCMNFVETALSSRRLETFVTAIEAAELDDTLNATGPFTVFAPTDTAFFKLPSGDLDSYFKSENRDQLELLLENHIVPGEYTMAELRKLGRVTTVNGKVLNISECPSCQTVNDSRILQKDIKTCNGVLHIIDAVFDY